MVLKKILFMLLLGIMCIPFLQYSFDFVKVTPLAGIPNKIENKPKIKIKSWFNNKFQDSTDTYFNENIGFRPWLIKLVNQIDYSLFNTTKAPGVVIGKDGNLFIESYILDYIGQNYIGKEKIDTEVKKLEEISNYLSQKNITLMVVFTPGKASYYPEFIPDKYDVKNKKTSNYEGYVSAFKKSKVQFLDFNDYFKKQKSKSPYPVYSKVGTHWSSYAKSYVLDSIVRYIEKERKIDIPDFDWSEIKLSDSLQKIDWDIEELMNLVFPIKHEKMPYPKYKYNETNKTKPSVIAIGDSYWWCLVGDDIPEHLFARDEYWFYNKNIYINNEKQANDVVNINFQETIMKQNVILLLATEATLHMFPYGFSEQFNNKILQANETKNLSQDEKIAFWEKKITKDPEWFQQIKEKAAKQKTTVKEMLRLNAIFMMNERK
jgi:hypothetical protein